jgi:proline utilization trans-activator
MSTAIDASLLEGHGPWSEVAYSILDEMASRGNMIAVFRKRELQKLASVLSHLPPPKPGSQPEAERDHYGRENAQNASTGIPPNWNPLNASNQMGTTNLDYQPFDGTLWPDELTAEQLMVIADSIGLDGLDWMTTSLGDSSAQSQIL